jgi:imidazolonepropionase-like amidohydrolase
MLFFGATSFAQRKATNSTLVINDVTVIDATGQPAAADMTIIAVGDRITEICKSDQVQIPRTARVIDGKGKFLIRSHDQTSAISWRLRHDGHD